MIGICTLTADADGDLSFEESIETKLDDVTARVSVTATLDGGGVISHYGFSDSDRKFEIKVNELDAASSAKLKAIFETYTYIYISTRLGLFKAAISRLWENLGAISMTVLIEQKYI